MKQRIVEISILETTTDEHFEKILSLIRILEGTCGAREIKRTEEKELNKIIDALTRNYKLTDAYKKGQTIKYRAKYLDTTLHAPIVIPDNAVGITISYPRSHLPSGIRITWLEPEK